MDVFFSETETLVVVNSKLRYDHIMTASWKRLQGSKAWTALIIATAFGAGLLPLAPGTWGTLVAVPIPFLLMDFPEWLRVLAWVSVTVAGVWSAKTLDESLASNDNQMIVIDEVVGFWLTAWTAGGHWQTLLAAFILFRFFDILKLPPVRQVDRWSKKASSPWLGGFGVIADDVLAGVQGLIIILILQQKGFLP